MKYLVPLFFFIFYGTYVLAAESLCDALNLVNCESVHKMTRRSSARSLPSSTTAAQFNPANVSQDRGLGVETMYQPNNSPGFSFVTGTGKAGAALVSSNLENGFFGNRVPELDDDYLERRDDKTQYQSPKYSLALGAAIFKRNNLSLDIGLLAKYNQKIKRVNPGAGAALRVGIFSLGTSVYQDDFYLKSASDSYQEKFTVQNYFAGVQIKNLFLDAGVIKTHYKLYEDDVTVRLFSASYIYKKLLLNMALRDESSPMVKYEDGVLVNKEKESSVYAGIQYSLNKYIILGVHYNYYLLDELAGSLVLFF